MNTVLSVTIHSCCLWNWEGFSLSSSLSLPSLPCQLPWHRSCFGFVPQIQPLPPLPHSPFSPTLPCSQQATQWFMAELKNATQGAVYILHHLCDVLYRLLVPVFVWNHGMLKQCRWEPIGFLASVILIDLIWQMIVWINREIIQELMQTQHLV